MKDIGEVAIVGMERGWKGGWKGGLCVKPERGEVAIVGAGWGCVTDEGEVAIAQMGWEYEE